MATGIQNIEPISVPDAAGINYAGGDVRHLSPTKDVMSAEAISTVTRQLAYRDKLISQAVNDLIAVVNNKDQFVNLPVPTANVPPGAVVDVTNFRIPPGFEARVLNATVSSTPTASAVRLDVLYTESTFGSSVGDASVVSTLSEFSAGTSFYGTGQFLIRFTNTAGRNATAAASLLLTMRPVGAQKGGIIGPGAKGEPGAQGAKGDKGELGSPGLPGPTGAPGVNWRGVWASGSNYAARDATHHDGSAYYALQSSSNQEPPTPDNAPSAYWDLIAKEGGVGATGPTGSIGAQGSVGLDWAGTWHAGSHYTFDQAVYYSDNNAAYISVGADNFGTTPPTSQYWDLFVGGVEGPPGPTGPVGINVQGTYDSDETYDQNDLVFYTLGSVTNTYIATDEVGTNEPPGTGDWQELFGATTGPSYQTASGQTWSYSGSNYAPGVEERGYLAPAAGSHENIAWTETTVIGGPVGFATIGMASLRISEKRAYAGELTVNLPQTGDGALVDWSVDSVAVQASVHGTVEGVGSYLPTLFVEDDGTNKFRITSLSASPSKLQFSILGQRPVSA